VIGRSRGIATPFGYVLTLAITTILVTGLLVAGGNFVEDQRDRVIESELEVVGEQVANHISSADRLNQSGEGDTTVRIEQEFPNDVTGQTYAITLVAEEDPYLQLNATGTGVSTQVDLSNTTALGQSRATGGTVVVEYNETDDEVVIGDG